MKKWAGAFLATAILGVSGACGSSHGGGDQGSDDAGSIEAAADGAGSDAGDDAMGRPGADGSTPRDAAPDATYVDVSVSTAACTTTFTFSPPSGTLATTVSVSGDWSSFANPGNPMTGPDANGNFTAQVALQPGLVAYK